VVISGVILGIAAALSQSASYVFSRLHVVRTQRPVSGLLVMSHLVMGVMSLVLLPFVWTDALPEWRGFIVPLVGCCVFYLLGQVSLFSLVRDVQASRIAPLLGFKLVVLAVISSLFLRQPLGLTQWCAVGLCVVAAAALNAVGGVLPGRSLLWLASACTAYSLSDLNIAWLVRSLAPLPTLHASLVGACLSYILCALIVVALLPFLRVNLAGGWRHAVPFGFFWFMGMVFLYGCFGTVGAVYGNILQSTRGVFSIVLGAALARAGMHELEHRVTRSVLVRRILAAVLMCVAIWIFQLG
jgi:hypothetical protein